MKSYKIIISTLLHVVLFFYTIQASAQDAPSITITPTITNAVATPIVNNKIYTMSGCVISYNVNVNGNGKLENGIWQLYHNSVKTKEGTNNTTLTFNDLEKGEYTFSYKACRFWMKDTIEMRDTIEVSNIPAITVYDKATLVKSQEMLTTYHDRSFKLEALATGGNPDGWSYEWKKYESVILGKTATVLEEKVSNTGDTPTSIVYSITAINKCQGVEFAREKLDYMVIIYPKIKVEQINNNIKVNNNKEFRLSAKVSGGYPDNYTCVWLKNGVQIAEGNELVHSENNTDEGEKVYKYTLRTTGKYNDEVWDVIDKEYSVKVSSISISQSGATPQCVYSDKSFNLSAVVECSDSQTLTYKWKNASGEIIGDNSATLTHKVINDTSKELAQSYTLTVEKVKNGKVIDTAEDTLDILVYPKINLEYTTANDTIICGNNNLFFGVKASGGFPNSWEFKWYKDGMPLDETNNTLSIKENYDYNIPIPACTGKWLFDNDDDIYAAAEGSAKLVPYQIAANNNTAPYKIDSPENATVERIDGGIALKKGTCFKMELDEAENVANYTIVFDVKVPKTSWRGLLQTDLDNKEDARIFISSTGKIHFSNDAPVSQVPDLFLPTDKWCKITLVVKDGCPTIYVNGKFLTLPTTNNNRWIIDKSGAYLFCDDDGQTVDIDIAGIYFWNKALTGEQITSMQENNYKTHQYTVVAINKYNGEEWDRDSLNFNAKIYPNVYVEDIITPDTIVAFYKNGKQELGAIFKGGYNEPGAWNFQWYLNNSLIENELNSTYIHNENNTGTTAQQFNYKLVATNTLEGNIIYKKTLSYTVNIYPEIKVEYNSSNDTIISGGKDIDFKVKTEGGYENGWTYQWYKNGVLLSGNNTNRITHNETNNSTTNECLTHTYKVIAINSYNGREFDREEKEYNVKVYSKITSPVCSDDMYETKQFAEGDLIVIGANPGLGGNADGWEYKWYDLTEGKNMSKENYSMLRNYIDVKHNYKDSIKTIRQKQYKLEYKNISPEGQVLDKGTVSFSVKIYRKPMKPLELVRKGTSSNIYIADMRGYINNSNKITGFTDAQLAEYEYKFLFGYGNNDELLTDENLRYASYTKEQVSMRPWVRTYWEYDDGFIAASEKFHYGDTRGGTTNINEYTEDGKITIEKNYFKASLSTALPASVNIYTINGAIIKTYTYEAKEEYNETIDIDSLDKGIYLIEVVVGNRRKVRKFVVE